MTDILDRSQPSSGQARVNGTPVPATRSPRRWIRRIFGGGQIVETCPAWCNHSHQFEDDTILDDLNHCGTEISVKLPVYDEKLGAVAMPTLVASIQVDPYSEDPERSIPFISFWPFEGEDTGPLDPDGFADVIAQVRAHCDRLERLHTQVVQARAEWTGGQA